MSNGSESQPEISDEELAEVGTILNLSCDFDMSAYKDTYLKRRVAIRMRLSRCRAVDEYCGLLRGDRRELDQLLKALTIHVSHFFRNPAVFDKLRRQILPEMFAAAMVSNAGSLRVCCMGCAGGEEPYSLAILLKEYFSREMQLIPVSIAASDIDEETLAVARQAEYNGDRVKEVLPELLGRFFSRNRDRYLLVPELRAMVNFSCENITSTERYPVSDLIMCRNTLIYFNRNDQERILTGMAAALAPGGILVLGKSEAIIGEARRYFVPISLSERIYRRV